MKKVSFNMKKVVASLSIISFIIHNVCYAFQIPSLKDSSVEVKETNLQVAVATQSTVGSTTTSSTSSDSQASNQKLGLQEEVDQATGTLSLNYDLIHLPGINNLDIDLKLSYNLNSSATDSLSGLPNGWGFNVSSISTGNPRSVHFNGSTYIIDPNWSDDQGYKSGLRYLNNHGVKFSAYSTSVLPPELQINGLKYYNYTLKYNDGSVDYFNNFGNPILKVDRYNNNHIAYFYDNTQKISKILDSYNQEISIEPDPNLGQGVIVITGPDKVRRAILYFNAQGVYRIVDAVGRKTEISYDATTGNIQTILYPNGLLTQIKYTTIPVKDCSGNAATRTVVKVLQHLNETREYTEYSYINGNHNYTGYPGKSCPGTDSLMDSGFGYTYDVGVMKSNISSDGQLISTFTTKTTYNYLHLPTMVTVFGQDGNPYFYTELTYPDSASSRARTPRFSHPIKVVKSIRNDSGNYQPILQIDTTFDDHGQQTSYTRYNCTVGACTPVSKQENTYAYNADPLLDFSLPQSQIVTDLKTGEKKTTNYTLTDDKKSIASVEMVEGKRITQFEYDPQGRKTKETLSNNGGSYKNGVNSTLTSYIYSFDPDAHTLSSVTIDPLGSKWTSVMDTQKGLLLSKTNPENFTINYGYDDLGRLTSVVDPNQNKTTYIYKTWVTDQINQKQIILPSGLTTYDTLDAMDRIVKREDNFSPKTGDFGSLRTLATFTYNNFGQLETETDKFGLATTHAYDQFDRETLKTDYYGNQTTRTYNDQTNEVIVSINGNTISKTTNDTLGRVVKKETYPLKNTAYDKSKYHIVQETTDYDGFDRETHKALQTLDPSTEALVSTLETHDFVYDTNGNLSSSTSNWNDPTKPITLTKTYSYDFLKNPVQYKKTRTAPNGTYSSIGELNEYDALSHLIQITYQDSTVKKFNYTKDGMLNQEIFPSGKTRSYTYDSNGNVLTTTVSLPTGQKVSNASNKVTDVFSSLFGSKKKSGVNTQANPTEINSSYNALNEPTSISDSNKNSITFRYKNDQKTVDSIVYSDGTTEKTISYDYDQTGRVLSLTDVNEHKTDYSYDDHNRILSISNNQTGDKESYVYYDSPADANGMIGRLKSHSIAGQIGAIVTSLQYDPFSRLGQQTTSNGANKTFEVRNNNYNDNSLLTSTVFSSTVDATDNSNYTLIYAYDASGLLAQYQKFPESSPSQASYSEQYQFDGNSNVIARTTRIDGTSKNISYTYDTSNRLTNYNDGSNHTPFAYDADGRMTTDDQGNAYTYDNFFDMITSVSNSTAGPIANYTYYPDGSRQTKTIAQSTGQPLPISFYHDAAGNLVNEVQSDGVSSSYLISPEGTQARYVKDSSGKDVVPSQYYTKDNKKVNKTLGSNPQITSYNYSPYGEKLGDTDKAPASIKDNPFGYEDTAMTDKETGLILLGARYYNPKLMRFMSMDSYPLENKYSYTNGDPINFSDPLGHMSGADTANLIIGIVTTIVAIAAAVPTGGASAAAATSAQAARAAGGLVMAKFVGQQALNGAARGVVAAVGMGVATNSVDAAFGEKKSAGEWGKSLALSATIGLVAGGVSGAASAGSALRTAASNGVMGDDSVAGFNFISKSQGNKVLQDPTNRKNMVSLIKLGFSAKTAEKLIKAKIIVKRLLPIALGSIAVGASVKGTHNLIRGVLKNPNRMAEEQDVEEMSVSQMIKNEESSKASPEPKKPDGVEFSRELSPFFNSEKEQL